MPAVQAVVFAHAFALTKCGRLPQHACAGQTRRVGVASFALVVGSASLHVLLYVGFAARGAAPHIVVDRAEAFLEILAAVEVFVVVHFIDFLHL